MGKPPYRVEATKVISETPLEAERRPLPDGPVAAAHVSGKYNLFAVFLSVIASSLLTWLATLFWPDQPRNFRENTNTAAGEPTFRQAGLSIAAIDAMPQHVNRKTAIARSKNSVIGIGPPISNTETAVFKVSFHNSSDAPVKVVKAEFAAIFAVNQPYSSSTMADISDQYERKDFIRVDVSDVESDRSADVICPLIEVASKADCQVVFWFTESPATYTDDSYVESIRHVIGILKFTTNTGKQISTKPLRIEIHPDSRKYLVGGSRGV